MIGGMIGLMVKFAQNHGISVSERTALIGISPTKKGTKKLGCFFSEHLWLFLHVLK